MESKSNLFRDENCYLKPPWSFGSSSFLAPSAGIPEEVPADEEEEEDGEGIFLGKANDSCCTEGRNLSLIVLQYFTFTFFVEIRFSTLKNSSFFVNPLFAMAQIGYIYMTSEIQVSLRTQTLPIVSNDRVRILGNLFDTVQSLVYSNSIVFHVCMT